MMSFIEVPAFISFQVNLYLSYSNCTETGLLMLTDFDEVLPSHIA